MTKSIFVQRISSTAQFILGFILGISLIAGISGTLVFAYYKKMSVQPKKPVFSEAPVSKSVAKKPVPSATIEPIESNVAESELEPEPKLELETEPEPEVVPEPEPKLEPLPPNAYRAEVTWPEGLSLRAQPTIDAERIGGIQFEDTIVILETSADGAWQQVRLQNGQEGWVSGGNTERVGE